MALMLAPDARRRSGAWPTRAGTTSSARSSWATTRAWCASSSSPSPGSSRASRRRSTPSPTRSSPTTRWAGGMSANALLMTYIGGVGAFAGPVVGAVLIVLLQSWVSLLSNSWLVYVGVLFILMVTFAPGGIAGLDPDARSRSGARAARAGSPARTRGWSSPRSSWRWASSCSIELCSFLTIGAAQGKTFHARRGSRWIRGAPMPWVVRRPAARRRAASGCGGEGRRDAARRGTRSTEEIKAARTARHERARAIRLRPTWTRASGRPPSSSA